MKRNGTIKKIFYVFESKKSLSVNDRDILNFFNIKFPLKIFIYFLSESYLFISSFLAETNVFLNEKNID